MASWDSLQGSRDLGTALVKGSFITDTDLAAAEEIAASTDKNLSEVLVEQNRALLTLNCWTPYSA